MLRNAFFLLFGLLNEVCQVSLRGIFHEKIQIVLIVVEHSRHKFYDVGVVE